MENKPKTNNQKPLVVTRFPPEPSGFLHLGHLKAIYGNLITASKKKGYTIFRLDDTNPSTSKQEFVDDIVSVLKKLELYDKFQKTSYASDYFDNLLEYQKLLIQKALAYFDHSDSSEISKLRNAKEPSSYRETTPDENLSKWDSFIKGELKDVVLRLKIDYNNGNAALRDPIAYRLNLDPHYRTGTKYKVYPTYDFACPIVDSLDGVTLAMRTNEFTDKDGIAKWIFENLPDLKKVKYQSFSRLQFEYSLLSKRKIRELVENKTVDGWEDPRLDTLVAIKRKGLLMETFESFFKSNGISKANKIEEWDRIYSINRKIIDQSSKRITALGHDQWDLEIEDHPDFENFDQVLEREVSWSPRNPDLGKKKILLSPRIRIDHQDAKLIKEDDLVYLLEFCGIKILSMDFEKKIIKAQYGDQEIPLNQIPHKISWLSQKEIQTGLVAETFYYDYLLNQPTITKDESVSRLLRKNTKETLNLHLSQNAKDLELGQIVQLVRFGFYKVDSLSPLRLIYIREPGNKKQYLLREYLPTDFMTS